MIYGALKGVVSVPGDKSITHRALLMAALAEGESYLIGSSTGEDCQRTIKALQSLGISIEEVLAEDRTALRVNGRGLFGFCEPSDVMDCGNSGTTLRLLTGLLAGQHFFSVLTGDASLRSRPMRRVVDPLRRMGATLSGRDHANRAPLAIIGGELFPIEYTLPLPSAQVKSAILLAGLMARGQTILTDPYGSRDHTERLLRHFGAPISQDGKSYCITGPASFPGKTVAIPGDLSSAAFLLVGAAILPGSKITVKQVGINPSRTGVLTVLERMGARLEIKPIETDSHEPVADITVYGSTLHGVFIEGEILTQVMDEIPILCIAAAAAKGETLIRGAEELRVKESDRIATMARALSAIGVSVKEFPDGLKIRGTDLWVPALCSTKGDHRIAMAMVIASLRINGEVALDNEACMATSFPRFRETCRALLQ